MGLTAIALFPTRVVSGPYGLVFALFVQYYFEVPGTYRFRMFGVNVGDKLLTYLLGLQLMGTQFPASLLASLAGIVAGVMYRSDTFPINRLVLPSSLVHLAQRWILPLLQQPRHRIPLNVNSINQQRGRPVVPPQHPSPEGAVTALMDMGFSREEAQAAMIQANNDTQLAAALLLDRH